MQRDLTVNSGKVPLLLCHKHDLLQPVGYSIIRLLKSISSNSASGAGWSADVPGFCASAGFFGSGGASSSRRGLLLRFDIFIAIADILARAAG